METVEVLVRIPKENYDLMIANPTRYNVCDDETLLYNHIKNGVVLPKGHGRIVDANRLKKDVYFEFNRPVDSMWTTREELDEKTIISIIDNTPTVIEASKEEKDNG